MFAIVELGGKQHKVTKGDVLDIEKVSTEPGKKFVTERVFLVEEKENTTIGQPFVEGSSVELKVIEHLRSEKTLVFKKKPKKRYAIKKGHRQPFSKVEVTKISLK